jgi:hypothetical protein
MRRYRPAICLSTRAYRSGLKVAQNVSKKW